MDWPRVIRPFLEISEDDDIFEYDKPSAFDSRILCQDIYGELSFRKLSNGKYDDWVNQWFEDDIFRSSQPSLQILMCSRIDPVTTVPDLISAKLFHLPFGISIWQKITGTFRFHNIICKALNESKCYSTYLVKQHSESTLEMYTAVMSGSWRDNLAVSSTHVRETKQTVAVIYGCNEEQMEMVKYLVEESLEVVYHPLLIIGIFAELQRNRLVELVEDVIHRCDEVVFHLKTRNMNQASDSFALSNELQACRFESKRLEEEVRATDRQLRKTIKHTEEAVRRQDSATRSDPTRGELSGGEGADPQKKEESEMPTEEFSTSLRRFEQRFEEIGFEFETLMADCRTSSEEMTSIRDLVMSDLSYQQIARSREETKATNHQAKASTVIAFVAMLYLPMTTVATIFAMPVFDFQNNWWNFRFRSVDTNSSSSGGGNTGNLAGSDGPVFSGYFWIYLTISGVLTGLTVGAWRYYTREDTGNHSRKPAARQGAASLTVDDDKVESSDESGVLLQDDQQFADVKKDPQSSCFPPFPRSWLRSRTSPPDEESNIPRQ